MSATGRNSVHPTAIIEGEVSLGVNNVILPYSILIGPLEVGSNNTIGPHTVIGSPGQDTRAPLYDWSRSKIRIGDGNIIREHVAIQKPCHGEITLVGDRCYVMHNVHVPHDAVLEDDVVLTPGVVLAGSVRVLRGANLALGCVVHQRTVIGQHAIVGMGSVVTKNVRPFSRHIPGQQASVNAYAIEKHGLAAHETEIADYVLSAREPRSTALKAIVGHYEALSRASGRSEY